MRSVEAVADAHAHERKADGESKAIGRIAVFDVFGTERLVRTPRNLYDARVLQKIVPLVSIADEKIDALERNCDPPEGHELDHRHRPPFDDPSSHADRVDGLDGSQSKLKTPFDAGYRTGRRLHEEHPGLRRPARGRAPGPIPRGDRAGPPPRRIRLTVRWPARISRA